MEFYTHVATWGDHALVRGYRDGERFQERVGYRPTMYMPSRNPTGFKTIEGLDVKPHVFSSLKVATQYVRDARDSGQYNFYGLDNFKLAYIADRWPVAPQVSLDELLVAFIDIEVYAPDGFPDVETADREINAITVYWKRGDEFKCVTFGNRPLDLSDLDVVYTDTLSEKQMLQWFLTWWKSLDVDILSGWATASFDIPYLVNRIRKVLGERSVALLSPWGIVNPRSKIGANGFRIETYDIVGIACIDYLEAYRKFRLKMRESYKLDYIGHVELDLRKVATDEYDSLAQLAEKDYEKFIRYNIRDVEIVVKLDDKLAFLTLITSLAYYAGVNFEDVFQQTRIWDGIMNRFLAARQIVLPPAKAHAKDKQIAGAYVMSPVPGKYEWVVSFDAASLYPNTLIALNLGIETLEHHVYQENVTNDLVLSGKPIDVPNGCALAGNGFAFSKTKKSFLAEAVQGVLDGRKVEKKKMLDAEAQIEKLKVKKGNNQKQIDDLKQVVSRANTLQSVYKVAANSAYGTMASPFFRFFDTRIAEAITLTGQLLIQFIRDRVNEFLTAKFGVRAHGYVIASDTDSVYVCLDRIPDPTPETVVDFADGELTGVLKAAVIELEQMLGVFETRWSFKREIVADAAIWTAKKRYIVNILYNEAGKLAEPEIKVTGIEAVRSTTPEWARDRIKVAMKKMLRENETSVQEYIKLAREEFMQLPPEDVALPTGVSSLDTYVENMEEGTYRDKTPVHVKASIFYNQMLMQMGIQNKYPPIRQGDKMRYVFLVHPNPAHKDVMGFPVVLPKDFGLHEYVDKERCFDRAFLRPVTKLLDAIKWSPVKRRTLQGFFK
jgi:DNA polymerase elongation subunit (family B)